MRERQWERKVYSFTVQKSCGSGDNLLGGAKEQVRGTLRTGSTKSDVVTRLGTVTGTVGLAIAPMLPTFEHPRAAIWVCLLAVVAYTAALRSYIVSRHRVWKTEATRVALNIVAVLLVLAIWMDHSVGSARPKLAPGQTPIQTTESDKSR